MHSVIKRNPWFRSLLFLIGLELIALAINFFYAPIEIAAGGTTGLAILAEAAFGINRSLAVFILNGLMVVLAWAFLGKKTVQNIALGSLLLPVLLALTPSFALTNNKLLAVIYGGALMGAGVALLYRINASPGGTTVPPLIFKKYFYLNKAIGLLIVDLIVISLNLLVDGMEAFLLAAFSQVVTTIVMRYAESGWDHKYQVQIMSNQYLQEIKEMLMAEYSSLTLYDVIGGYTNSSRQQILLVVDTQDYGPLIRKIHQIDPDAFIISSNVMKVHGGRWGL